MKALLCLLLSALTVSAVNITNYPIRTTLTNGQLFFLSDIPAKTNFNLAIESLVPALSLTTSNAVTLISSNEARLATNAFPAGAITNYDTRALYFTNTANVFTGMAVYASYLVSTQANIAGVQLLSNGVVQGESAIMSGDITADNGRLLAGGNVVAGYGTGIGTFIGDGSTVTNLPFNAFSAAGKTDVTNAGTSWATNYFYATNGLAFTILNTTNYYLGIDTNWVGTNIVNKLDNNGGVGTNLLFYGNQYRTNWTATGPGGWYNTNVQGGSVVISNGSIRASGTLTATNGLQYIGKHPFYTNYTMTEGEQVYQLYGTNQLITMLNCTNTQPYVVYRFSMTNGWGSFILTNANGVQTIRDGFSKLFTQIGIGSPCFFHDGASWWPADKTKVVLPSAQFSCTTNITLAAANTSYPITFNSTDFNNSQGIALVAGQQIWITNSGIYELDPSVVINPGGANHTVRFWFRLNGANVANSATPTKVSSADIVTVTVPFIINVTAASYVELYAQSDSITTAADTISAQAAGGSGGNAYPATPSVICPVKRISDTWP